jgi:hypothetical protein
MNTKQFLLILFIVINVLTLVYAQNQPGDKSDSSTTSTTTSSQQDPTVDPEPQPNPEPIPQPPTPPQPEPTTTTSTPMTPEPSPSSSDKQQPTTSSKEVTTTPKSIAITTTTKVTMISYNITAFEQLTTTKPTVSVTTQTVSTSEKKTSIVRRYPQTKLEEFADHNNNEPNSKYLTTLYIISGVMCTALVGFATLTLYKKGLGDEANNNSNNWETGLDEDSYSRNKSTISRNTLTPSVRNAAIGSPTSNPNNSRLN